MRKKLALLLCAAMLTGTLTGCGNEKQETVENNAAESADNNSSTAGKENQNEENSNGGSGGEAVGNDREAEEIRIWHDGDEAITGVIETKVNEILSADNITVRFEKKSGLTDQIKLYGNDETSGPDLYMYAHDSLGTFVEMGVLAPITQVVDQSVYGDMLPMTVQAGQYKEEQYMLPLYFETLLFMYNKELWEGEIPSTTEDLYAYIQEHTDTGAGTYALVNQHSTCYNVAPIINGFGGYVIDKEAHPGLNDEKTKEAIEYNKKFAALQADGDYNTVTTLFNEGKAAAIIGGPWLVSGIKEAGIDLGVKSLSDITLPNGEGMAPFSGVQGIGMMKYAAESKGEALEKVFTALASPEIGIELAKQASCAPANEKAYEDAAVSGDEIIDAMRRTASTAEPMPNIPEMSVLWGPSEALLAAVNKSGEDLDAAAEQYQKEAETAIADMQ